jgi:hypothetical protein
MLRARSSAEATAVFLHPSRRLVLIMAVRQSYGEFGSVLGHYRQFWPKAGVSSLGRVVYFIAPIVEVTPRRRVERVLN